MTRRQAQDLLHGELTSSIIASMYEVHQELGYGYREYIYTLALEELLIAKGHRVRREVATMVYFRGKPLAKQVFDMVVDDDTVIVEIKSTERLPKTQPVSSSATSRRRRRNSKLALFSISAAKRKPTASSSRIA